jgi:hypothetical protein
MPYSLIAVLPTPRMAALIPGQSPPAVSIPILIPRVESVIFSGVFIFAKVIQSLTGNFTIGFSLYVIYRINDGDESLFIDEAGHKTSKFALIMQY